MSVRKRLAKNTVFASLTAMGDVFNLVLLVVAGRFLGVENFGTFTSALAISVIAAFALNLGLDNLAIRKIAVDRSLAPRIIGSVLGWKLLLGVLAILAFSGYELLFDPHPTGQIVRLVLFSAGVLKSLNITCRAFLHSFERFDLETLITVGERIIVCAGGLAVLLGGHGVVALALVMLASRVLSFGGYLAAMRSRLTAFSIRLDPAFVREFQGAALPFGSVLIVQALFTQADILILTALADDQAVGFFGAPFRVFDGLLVFPMVITSVAYPQLCALLSTNEKAHRELWRRTLKYLSFAGVVIGATGVLFSGRIIDLLYGPDFQPSAAAMMLLLLATLLHFPNYVMFATFRSMGGERTLFKIFSIALPLKILVDLTLIPRIGFVGAAVGILAGGLFLSVPYAVLLGRKGYRFGPLTGGLVRMVALAAVIVLALRMVPGWPWPVQLGVELLLFFVGAILVRAFDRQDLDSLAGVWPASLLLGGPKRRGREPEKPD